MKKILLFFTVLTLVFAFCSCRYIGKNEAKVVKVCQVNDFHRVKATGDFELCFVKGNVAGVKLKGCTRKDIENVVVKEENGTLLVSYKEHDSKRVDGKPLTVYITAPNLEDIVVNGDVVMSTPDPFEMKKITMSVDGDCVMNLKLKKVEGSIFHINGDCVLKIDYDSCGWSQSHINGDCVASYKGTLRERNKSEFYTNGDVVVSNKVEYIK